MDKNFLACSYAFMILHDEKGLEVSADKINVIMEASDLKVPSYFAKFFVSNMKGVNV